MIELALVVALGIFVGILTGLMPALPVYTGPFLLYYFGQSIGLEYLLIFWLVVVTGSQFFGSVATITTNIPGEESSLVYLKDLGQFSIPDKRQLLYDTAKGSAIAGVIATIFSWVCVSVLSLHEISFFASNTFSVIVYTAVLASFCFINRSIAVTFFLVLAGILIAPRNNYALPDVWYSVSFLFAGTTFYMLVLGLVILPELLSQTYQKVNASDLNVERKSRFSGKNSIISSIIGVVAGLIPGPSAFVGSAGAYKMIRGDAYNKISAAETANNASVLTSALPLLLIALPINQNTLIFANIMEIRGWTLTEMLTQPSFISWLTVFDLTSLVVLLCIGIYFLLSTNLITLYTKIINTLYGKMRFILAIILLCLIGVDLFDSELSAYSYFIILSLFVAVGYILRTYKISPLPLLFSIILGDKLIWSYIQFYKIHF